MVVVLSQILDGRAAQARAAAQLCRPPPRLSGARHAVRGHGLPSLPAVYVQAQEALCAAHRLDETTREYDISTIKL